jgi:hypothetical protein
MGSYNEKYDVIVCGGGTSGVSAAIASARGGAKTLLIERLGALGGQMNVSGPPGFSYANLWNKHEEQVIAGIIEETHNRLLKEGHAKPHCHNVYRAFTGYTFSYIDPEWWGLMIFEMMTENGVNLLLHTLVVDVVKDGDKVTGVVVENANGRNTLSCEIVIECTGEGDIAVRAGCDFEIAPRDEIQPHSLSFTMAGVDWVEFLDYVKKHPDEIVPRSNRDKFTEEERHRMLQNFQPENIDELGEIMGWDRQMNEALEKGEWHPYSGVGFFMAPRPDVGVVQAHMQHSSQVSALYSHDAWDLTEGEVVCRQQIKIAINFFKKYIPGFKNAYVTRICNEMRLREGRRIMGDHYLTTDEVVAGTRFYDCIGKSGFSAGAHHVANTNTLAKTGKPVEGGGTHDIPYRCLVPKKVENLLVAGKHVSTDRDAYLRYLQQTMVTGQAAGAAAALCIKHGVTPRELEAEEYVKELQDILRAQGAILEGVK